MTIYDIFPDIEKNPIFLDVSHSVVNQFLNDASISVEVFSAGTVAYSSDTGKIRIGIVLSGIARVHTGAAGINDHALLRTLYPGDMFGIANLYAEQEPFPSRIISAEKCKILFIDGNAFKQVIENDSVALRNYLAFLSKKIVYLNRKIMTYTAGSAEKKLVVYLLDHEVNQTVVPSCSMSELAELLGMGRASLYRAIDTLTEYGWILKQDKNIQLLDKGAMEQSL